MVGFEGHGYCFSRLLTRATVAAASVVAAAMTAPTKAEAGCRGCWIGAGIAAAAIGGAIIANSAYGYGYGYGGYAPAYYGYAPSYGYAYPNYGYYAPTYYAPTYYAPPPRYYYAPRRAVRYYYGPRRVYARPYYRARYRW